MGETPSQRFINGSTNDDALFILNFPVLYMTDTSWLASRIDSLPIPAPQDLNADQASKSVLESGYAVSDHNVQADDPLGISAGANVTVESTE